MIIGERASSINVMSASSTIAMHRPRKARSLAIAALLLREVREAVARLVRSQVAKVVEAHFAGGAVAHIGAVGTAPLLEGVELGHARHTQAEVLEQRPHRGRVALCQIVVGDEHMHRNTRQRGGAGRQGHGDGLALATTHLGQTAVEDDPGRKVLHFGGPQTELEMARVANSQQELCGHVGAEPLSLRLPKHLFLPRQRVDSRQVAGVCAEVSKRAQKPAAAAP